jgi:hypothetical protein
LAASARRRLLQQLRSGEVKGRRSDTFWPARVWLAEARRDPCFASRLKRVRYRDLGTWTTEIRVRGRLNPDQRNVPWRTDDDCNVVHARDSSQNRTSKGALNENE